MGRHKGAAAGTVVDVFEFRSNLLDQAQAKLKRDLEVGHDYWSLARQS